MKKTIILLAALAGICLQADAQDSRLMLRLNSFSGYKTNKSIYTSTSAEKDIRILPSIGYAHTFKNNTGIAAEFGFTNATAKGDVNLVTSTGTTTKKGARDYKSYYIGLSVYESFKLKKYVGNIGLLLPLEFVKPQDGVYETITYENSTQERKKELITETLPKQLKSGLYLQASLYRQVFKKIYLGAELGAGVAFTRTSGEQEQLTENYVNGVMTNSVASKITVKQNEYDLGLRASVSLQYIF